MKESDFALNQYIPGHKLNMYDKRAQMKCTEEKYNAQKQGTEEKWIVLRLIRPKTFRARLSVYYLYVVWKR